MEKFESADYRNAGVKRKTPCVVAMSVVIDLMGVESDETPDFKIISRMTNTIISLSLLSQRDV